MFLYEIDKAVELLETYESSIVEKELIFEAWMDGEYKYLVPDILSQVIHAARFMEYLSHALVNDETSVWERICNVEDLYEDYGWSPEPWYMSVFDDFTSKLALHMINQKHDIFVDREYLAEGMWTARDYYNFLSLNRLMHTLGLLCHEVFVSYYATHDDENMRRLEEDIDSSWLEDDETLTFTNWDIEYDVNHTDQLLDRIYDWYRYDEMEELHPPFLVRYRHKEESHNR